MSATFQLFKSGNDNQYYYRLRSANNEIILHGEGYTSKQNAQHGIASVKANAPDDSRYNRSNVGGSYTFTLFAANGEIIGRSESYTTAAARENGIEAVKRDAPNAPVDDLT